VIELIRSNVNHLKAVAVSVNNPRVAVNIGIWQADFGRRICPSVDARNLKNKIGAGSALILSLRNSAENPKRFNGKRA